MYEDTYRRENPKLVERAIEMTRLQRSKKVYEDMFSILLEKGEEARIKSATGTGGIRIIDSPVVPARPVPAHAPRNLAIGLMLGLGMGFGLAMLRDYLDNTIRSQDELTRHTGLAVMGAVAEIRTKDLAARKAGKSAHNVKTFPLEMFASQRMGDFIAQCWMMYDLVIIDAPPVRLVTDPLLFAAKATHVLLVVKANSTQMRDVQEATALMRRAQTPILGVLFNYIKTTRGYGDYHRYNYYYESYSTGKKA